MTPRSLVAAAVLAGAASLPAAAAEKEPFSHKDAFEHYEGTKTCLACHRKEAESFFEAQHYQWRGNAPQIVGAGARKLGKLNTINDFCTGPGANWIGLVKNSRGEILSKGCSKCHAGLGKLPEEKVSDEQLNNIDCLICHAKGYQRDLYPTADGGFEWKPILWRNQEGLDSVSKRISRPQRVMCLRCHSASGGGPNYKRGDLEYRLADTTRDYDVHMGTDGANLHCVDCHAGDNHRVRGRGADLAATDHAGPRLTCDGECHGAAPHAAPVLNHHARRVYCTVCHIRAFARDEPTDMVRDWSKPVYNPEGDRWTATIQLEKDVTPVYAWWDGFTRAQLPGEPIARVAPGGPVGMMVPQGGRSDPKARLYAFKLHKGKLPVLDGKNWIVPILVEHFFADGDIDAATKKAAKETYGVHDAKYTWTDTVRYMGVFHSVPPASQALECLDCHGPKGRLDWGALGYAEGDPLLARLKTD
jgi:hypothetical protein